MLNPLSSVPRRFGSWFVLCSLSCALAPILSAGAAECVVSNQAPMEFVGKPPPGLHSTSNLSAAHTATHGQIVLGRETPRYLYHLPVFMTRPAHHPHNFQVVIAVSPVDEADDAVAGYKIGRSQHQGKLYTAVPPRFDQLALTGEKPLRQLDEVTLVRGHFEKNSAHALEGTTNLEIERIVYFNEFDPGAEREATLAYLLLGTPQEQYMVHLLSGPPDFDQVLEVSVNENSLSKEQLATGVFVTFDQRRNESNDRLISGERLTCTVPNSEAELQLTMQVVAEHYCELGELEHAVTETFGTPRACDER